jgi:hypothetical protein
MPSFIHKPNCQRSFTLVLSQGRFQLKAVKHLPTDQGHHPNTERYPKSYPVEPDRRQPENRLKPVGLCEIETLKKKPFRFQRAQHSNVCRNPVKTSLRKNFFFLSHPSRRSRSPPGIQSRLKREGRNIPLTRKNSRGIFSNFHNCFQPLDPPASRKPLRPQFLRHFPGL